MSTILQNEIILMKLLCKLWYKYLFDMCVILLFSVWSITVDQSPKNQLHSAFQSLQCAMDLRFGNWFTQPYLKLKIKVAHHVLGFEKKIKSPNNNEPYNLAFIFNNINNLYKKKINIRDKVSVIILAVL